MPGRIVPRDRLHSDDHDSATTRLFDRDCAGLPALGPRGLLASRGVKGGGFASEASADEGSPLRRPWTRELLIASALFVASFLLYTPSISSGFDGFDTPSILRENPDLYDERSLSSSLANILVHRFPREEPLLVRDLSWAIDAWIFGFDNPLGYHLGNVFWNAVNVALLYLFMLASTRDPRWAFGTAALFGLLPVHVEAVSWIMGRKDLLATAFMLLALLAQVAHLDALGARRRALYLASIGLGLLAVLSKINALSLVLVLPLHELLRPYLAKRADASISWRRVAAVAVKYAPHAAAYAAIFIWYQRVLSDWGQLFGRGPSLFTLEHLSTLAVFAPLSLGLGLRAVFVPANYSVSYALPSVDVALTASDLAIAGLSALAIPVALVYAARRRRDLLFFGLAFLALMLPYANLVYVGIWVANRYLYFSTFCVLAVIVAPVVERPRWWSIARIASVPLALLALLAVLEQQRVWRDDESLWRHEAAVRAPSVLAFRMVAQGLIEQAKATPGTHGARLAEAEEWLARGEAQFRSYTFLETPYYTRHLADYTGILRLRAELSRLRGEGPRAQLPWLLEAERLKPASRQTTRELAMVFFELATTSTTPEESRRLAFRSLEYFAQHAIYSPKEPRILEGLRHELDMNYARAFPALADPIARVRAKYLEHP